MAALHAKYTVGQPMANRRSDAMWRHAVKYRVSRPGDELYTEYGPSELTGYFVTHREGDSLDRIEAVGQNLPALAAGCLAQAWSTGVRRVTNRLPPASPVAEILAAVSDTVVPAEETSWMARPIADRISWADLAAILLDPRGRRSELDNF